jgi:hypothetical protein
VKVSPTANNPKKAVMNAITPKPARLRMRARFCGSGCLARNTTAKMTMIAMIGKSTVMSHLHPNASPGTPGRPGGYLHCPP